MKVLLLAALLTGCASLPPCLFGSDVPAENAACAIKNFGREGAEAIVRSVNRDVLDRRVGDCKAHYAAVSAKLQTYGYLIEPMHTPEHVSALVTDPVTGAQFVADNGWLIPASTYGGVATLAEFNADWRRSLSE